MSECACARCVCVCLLFVVTLLLLYIFFVNDESILVTESDMRVKYNLQVCSYEDDECLVLEVNLYYVWYIVELVCIVYYFFWYALYSNASVLYSFVLF